MTKNGFTRNVMTMLGGTSIALVIPLLLSPVLARLFQPEAFGQLALYMSVSSIGAVAATGRYELAITLPRHKATAFSLMIIAISSSAIFSIGFSIFCLIIYFIHPEILGQTLSPVLWILAIPLGIFLISCTQSLTYWQTRLQMYRLVASARAMQAIATTGTQTSLGLISNAPIGLISGHFLGAMLGVFNLVRKNANEIKSLWNKSTHRLFRSAARRYIEFPKYMIAGHLANVISSQLPVMMLAILYGPKQAGWYALAERVTAIPIGVIGNSVGEVYRQEASRQYQANGNCFAIYIETSKKLVLLGLAPAIFMILFGPNLFGWIFGKDWQEAGNIVSVLSLIVLCQTISSPLSQTVLFASMYRADLIWQFLRLLLSGVALYLGYRYFQDFMASIILYAITFALLYSLHSALQYIAARGNMSSALHHFQ